MSEMTENTQKCSFRATGTSSCTFFIKSNFFCHFSSRYMSMVVYKDLQIQISNFFEKSGPLRTPSHFYLTVSKKKVVLLNLVINC